MGAASVEPAPVTVTGEPEEEPVGADEAEPDEADDFEFELLPPHAAIPNANALALTSADRLRRFLNRALLFDRLSALASRRQNRVVSQPRLGWACHAKAPANSDSRGRNACE